MSFQSVGNVGGVPVAVMPPELTLVRVAPVRSAPVRFAPVRTAPVRVAPVSSAPLKSTLFRSTPVRSAELKSAPEPIRYPLISCQPVGRLEGAPVI